MRIRRLRKTTESPGHSPLGTIASDKGFVMIWTSWSGPFGSISFFFLFCRARNQDFSGFIRSSICINLLSSCHTLDWVMFVSQSFQCLLGLLFSSFASRQHQALYFMHSVLYSRHHFYHLDFDLPSPVYEVRYSSQSLCLFRRPICRQHNGTQQRVRVETLYRCR